MATQSVAEVVFTNSPSVMREAGGNGFEAAVLEGNGSELGSQSWLMQQI